MSTRVAIDDHLRDSADPAAALDDLPRVDAHPTLKPAALYGWAGRVVRAIAPYSEADDAAVLLTVLVGAGNMLGDGPHARVQADRHPMREFALLTGTTSKGRKGLSASTPRELFRRVDPTWCDRSGLSSGEGLINNVRDAREEKQAIKERNRVVGYETVIADHGVEDKRLFLLESEFASVTRRMEGDGNSLSPILRQAWDSGNLATLTKNTPLKATGAHISLVAHITREELAASVPDLALANGLLNRFLIALVKRSKLLPDGPVVPETTLEPLVAELRMIGAFAQTVSEMKRDPEAREAWHRVYGDLADVGDGLTGAVLGRAEAHVLRLSLIYAVLDRSPLIRSDHLLAALALWEYCAQSARVIFGGRLGLPVADQILAALRERGPLSREDLHGVFSRHVSAPDLDAAIANLLDRKLIEARSIPTKGRPRTVYALTPKAAV